MAHPISPDRDRDAAFRPGGGRNAAQSDVSDLDAADDAMPPEMSISDKNRNRVWRAMSWILLVNVILFWLMTWITAFAQTTAT